MSTKFFLTVILVELLPWAAVTSHILQSEEESPSLLRIELQREVVPIRRNGKVVSSKTSYFGSLSVGTPAQEFRMVMDTGSGHVVVPSARCYSKACALHRRYDLNTSSTGKAVNADGSEVESLELADQLTIGFGTGEVLGEFATEHVCLHGGAGSAQVKEGEQAPSPLCVDMRIVTAVEMSEQPFATFGFDGILGLSLSGLALSPEFSFFGSWASSVTAISKGSTQARQGLQGRASQFAFFLTDEEEKEKRSELVFGGHDASQSLEAISWVPVALPRMGFWQLTITSVRVGGVELDFCKDGQCRGVLDTGTSHIGVPGAFHQTLTDLLTLPEAGPDCREIDAPELVIEVPGKNLTLGPSHYMRKLPLKKGIRLSESGGIGSDSEMKKQAFSQLRNASKNADDDAKKFCRPRLMPVNLPAPLGPKLFLLGEPLLHRYYTVFDWNSQQVGLGLSASCLNKRLQETEAKRQQTAQAEHEPQQVDDIILLQLPGRASITKTRFDAEASS
jgi:hypothetical protein